MIIIQTQEKVNSLFKNKKAPERVLFYCLFGFGKKSAQAGGLGI